MTERVKINLSPSFFMMELILVAILAWFIYGTTNAVLAVLVIAICIGLVFVLSLIPVVGWIAAILIAWLWMIPKLLILGGIHWTWLITAMLLLNIAIGLIVTVVMTFIALKLLYAIFFE